MPEVQKPSAMSVVNDVRGLLQDLVTPDLKTTVAKLDNLSTSVEARLKAQDEIAAARHNELLARLETFNAQIETYNTQHLARYDSIMKALDVDKRLRALEQKEAQIA